MINFTAQNSYSKLLVRLHIRKEFSQSVESGKKNLHAISTLYVANF